MHTNQYKYNKCKNQVILFTINVEANNCYYVAVKNLSELNSLRWLRSKKEAIINGNNGFQNALDDALNYQTIETHPERISKLKPYINKYNWEGIEFPAGPKDWKKIDQNNKTIALNILYVPYNAKTRATCKSEYNHKHKNQVILLMITDGNKRYYTAVSSLSALLRGKSSNHHRDFYSLNCFNLYSTKNSLVEILLRT